LKREKKKRVFSIPKMAHMLPTLREKKRYLVYEVITNKEITKQDAENAVKQAIKEFIGDYGMAKANIRFMKDWLNNKAS
jgi:RNase P/RNase MRP subunit POP5